jgi:hypothetical protein
MRKWQNTIWLLHTSIDAALNTALKWGDVLFRYGKQSIDLHHL